MTYVTCTHKQISFEEITKLRSVDTSYSANGATTIKQIAIIVNNYQSRDEIKKAIDSFAFAKAKNYKDGFNDVLLIFYKASKITNKAHLKENPRDLDRYSENNDMLFTYAWQNGKFKGKRYHQ